VPLDPLILPQLDAWRLKDEPAGSLSKAEKTAERRMQKQKRKMNEGKLVEKRHQMDKVKVCNRHRLFLFSLCSSLSRSSTRSNVIRIY
jgi:hypothetical protein